MARPSIAALAIVATTPDKLLPPPSGLSDAEIILWQEITASKPAGWFGEDSGPVLKEYVRAAVMCDVLDDQIKVALESGAPGVVKQLLELRDRESRRVANLATKLRLTQQSRYTPQAAATADKRAGGKRPWQA